MNHEVGKRCTDGYRYGTIIERDGAYVKVQWDYGGTDPRPRERGTVRVIE